MIPAAPTDEPDSLDVTAELLWTFTDKWARRTLRSLHEADQDQIPLEDLADRVAGEDSKSKPAGSRKVELRLHHSSLPKLDQHGLVDYDGESRVVRNTLEKRVPEDLITQLHPFNYD